VSLPREKDLFGSSRGSLEGLNQCGEKRRGLPSRGGPNGEGEKKCFMSCEEVSCDSRCWEGL